MLGDNLDISIGDDGEDDEGASGQDLRSDDAVSYTHLRAHET